MSNLYLPSEPPVYNYVYKFDQIDYALVPGIGACRRNVYLCRD